MSSIVIVVKAICTILILLLVNNICNVESLMPECFCSVQDPFPLRTGQGEYQCLLLKPNGKKKNQ